MLHAYDYALFYKANRTYAWLTASYALCGNERFTTTSVDDLGSHIGLRGSHPIGGSNQVTWQFSEDVPVGQADTSMRGYFRNKKNSSTPISYD